MPYHLLSVEDTEVWPGETDTLTGHCPVGKEEHNAIWSGVCSKVELAGEYIRDPIVFLKFISLTSSSLKQWHIRRPYQFYNDKVKSCLKGAAV